MTRKVMKMIFHLPFRPQRAVVENDRCQFNLDWLASRSKKRFMYVRAEMFA